MTIRRLAGVAAAALLLALAHPAAADAPILAVTGKVTGGEINLTLAEEVRNAQFHARSVWQIHAIEIE